MMNNCKNDNKQLEELKNMGLDGLYELVLDQKEQINKLNEKLEHCYDIVRAIIKIESM